MKLCVRHYDALESTNLSAAAAAAAGAPEGTVLVARRQYGGRGRMRREWLSPEGGLWFSIILRPQVNPERAPQLTLLAAVAVAQAVRRLYRTGQALIKWPNDILLDGKKICGILSELQLDENGAVAYAVIGIGINVAVQEEFPPQLRGLAVSLNKATGLAYACEEVLQAVLEELAALYAPWLKNGADLLPLWKSLSCTLGRQVVVKDDDKVLFRGIAEDLDGQGALIVRDADGVRRSFDFGEISIR